MINCRFKPIDQWPGNPTKSYLRKDGRFKASWSQTLDLLERELNHLRATDIIIDGYFGYGDIRNDGWPKSKARPTQPGIILSFNTKRGRMSIPCDTFKEWESNLRAIALTLECLRTVERYGVTTARQEQYTGWLKLSAASPDDEAQELAKALIIYANVETDVARVLSDSMEFERVWKAAVKENHPDTASDEAVKTRKTESLKLIIAARDRLKKLRGWQ